MLRKTLLANSFLALAEAVVLEPVVIERKIMRVMERGQRLMLVEVVYRRGLGGRPRWGCIQSILHVATLCTLYECVLLVKSLMTLGCCCVGRSVCELPGRCFVITALIKWKS